MTTLARESVTVAPSSREEILGEDVIGSIEQEAGQLRQVELSYEPSIKTLWITLAPEPKPVFTYDMLNSLNSVHGAVHKLWGSSEKYNSSPIRFVAFRGRGAVLTLGGDLDFYLDCLARGDRAALAEYARVSMEGVCWNASSVRGSAITLAIVQGKAFGGGIDAPCSCNIVVAETQASFSYPEVKFNHFPITAVSVLSRRAGPRQAHKIFRPATSSPPNNSKASAFSMRRSQREKAKAGCAAMRRILWRSTARAWRCSAPSIAAREIFTRSCCRSRKCGRRA